MKNEESAIEILQRVASDNEWVQDMLKKYWNSTRLVSKGRVHEADKLPSFIARQSGVRVGLIVYEIARNECEIVALKSLKELIGVGSLLVNAVKSTAAEAQCKRVWLVTTNDNTQALKFYLRRGFALSAFHLNAIERSRKLKPEIPIIGQNGTPIRDEIELEIFLQ
jgi:N-acetylglutamate synthase-like GNAT family acetyltransferase